MPSQLGWIWPKDPRPGNPKHWPRRWRIFDVLTSKGPDIYVGRIDQPKNKTRNSPSRPQSGTTRQEWSRWEINPNDPESGYNPIPWARRPAGSAMISARGSITFRTMGRGVLLSIAMGEGLGEGNGLGRRRCIVCRGDIGIGMELSIRRNFGTIAFMGSTGIEGK
ncbi:hypothetical protein N7453_007309 [Penicillium expansum]|nr:hypothetical protein N7453_007309 [Penicillium expansum]